MKYYLYTIICVYFLGTQISFSQKNSTSIQFLNTPTKDLQSFVNDIEELSWIPDTLRLQKVKIYSFLKKEHRKYFSEKPFYKTTYAQSAVAWAEKLSKDGNYEKEVFKRIDYDLFKNARSIWNYFYRKKDAKHMISDGVITQWEFSSIEEAKKAYKQLMSVQLFIHFNTKPYFCQKDNYVYEFSTRAMAFSYDQKKVFKQFLETYINN